MDRLEKYMNKNYKITIEKIDESEGGGYRASIPQLGDKLFQDHGDTIEEAIQNLEHLKKMLFAEYINKKIPIPEPEKEDDFANYSGKFILRVPKTVHRKLARQAKAEGVSLNQYLNYLIVQNHTANAMRKEIEQFQHSLSDILAAYDFKDTKLKLVQNDDYKQYSEAG